MLSWASHVQRTASIVWSNDNQNLWFTNSLTEVATNGLRSWHTVYRDPSTPVVSRTQSAYGGGGSRTVTSYAPDGSYILSSYSYGRLSSVTRKISSHAQIGQTTYAYDPHGRVASTTDARNGATPYAYNAGDQAQTLTTPAPGTGQAPQLTSTFYDTQDRQTGQLLPDGTYSAGHAYLCQLAPDRPDYVQAIQHGSDDDHAAIRSAEPPGKRVQAIDSFLPLAGLSPQGAQDTDCIPGGDLPRHESRDRQAPVFEDEQDRTRCLETLEEIRLRTEWGYASCSWAITFIWWSRRRSPT